MSRANRAPITYTKQMSRTIRAKLKATKIQIYKLTRAFSIEFAHHKNNAYLCISSTLLHTFACFGENVPNKTTFLPGVTYRGVIDCPKKRRF